MRQADITLIACPSASRQRRRRGSDPTSQDRAVPVAGDATGLLGALGAKATEEDKAEDWHNWEVEIISQRKVKP